jgi:methionine biosynthesis protein MetW
MNPLFDKLWHRGYAETNRKNILSYFKNDQGGRFIDLGCDDGSLTIDAAKKIDTKSVFGLEKNPGSLADCKKKGIQIIMGDLDKGIPIRSESFDIILSNQVIEHVCYTDLLLKEIYRILKPEGYAIISTNNISSWTNIIALLFGKQPFPNHPSDEILTGRFLSKDELLPTKSFAHRRIFSFPSLSGLLKYHHFEIIEKSGSCFYPFWGFIEKFFSSILPIYSAYIIIKIKKIISTT